MNGLLDTQLDTQLPSQQEKDLIFHGLEQEKTPPPSLSLIPALLQLVKESWDKPPSTLQTPHRVEHHYNTHGLDTTFLLKYPTPKSIVVESTQYKSHTKFSITLLNREVSKMDSMG